MRGAVAAVLALVLALVASSWARAQSTPAPAAAPCTATSTGYVCTGTLALPTTGVTVGSLTLAQYVDSLAWTATVLQGELTASYVGGVSMLFASPNLPTSDPGIANAIWNNGGMLAISCGQPCAGPILPGTTRVVR